MKFWSWLNLFGTKFVRRHYKLALSALPRQTAS
jgi:hypothetical protein